MTRFRPVQVRLPAQLELGSAPDLGCFGLFLSQLANVAGLMPKMRAMPRMLGLS